MTALVEWVERRTGTSRPRLVLYIPAMAVAAVVAAIIQALP